MTGGYCLDVRGLRFVHFCVMSFSHVFEASLCDAELLMFYAVCPFCFAGTVPLFFSPIKWNAGHLGFQAILLFAQTLSEYC